MAEEIASDVKQMIAEENDINAKAIQTSEEGSVEMIPIADEESKVDVSPSMSTGEMDIQEISEVLEPEVLNLRRHSTGVIEMRQGKAKVQSRYLRNHVSSTHDVCKHGKRQEDDVVKPWKMVRKKCVEGEDAEKVASLGVRRRSLGGACGQISGFRPKNGSPAKREAMVVGKPIVSANCESSSSKEGREVVRSGDGSSVKRSVQTGKNKETEKSPSASGVARKVTGLRNEETKTAVTKVPKVGSKDENSVSSLKNVRSGQKTKIEPVSSRDAPEKTLYVVEASVEKRNLKGVQGEIQQTPGKKITRKSVRAPKDVPSSSPSSENKGSRTTKSESLPTRMSSRTKSSISPGLHKRKESVSADKPKKKGIKVTPLTRQLSFKRGKVLEPKSEDSTPTWIKFKRRVTPGSSKVKSDGTTRKSLKDKRDSNNGKSISSEGKPEKVVLRHRKVETRNKLQTLFNNVIEETASKLAEVKKSKVKALVGAFETVIFLQDNKSSHKHQSRATTSTAEG